MKLTIEFYFSSYNWNQFHHFLPGEIIFPKMLEEFVLFKYTWLSSIFRVVKRKDGWVTKTIPPKRAMAKIKDLKWFKFKQKLENDLYYHLIICLSNITLPEKIFKTVKRSFMKITARIIVKRGVVNINVIASQTGMNLTLAKAVSMVKLPNNPTNNIIVPSHIVRGNILFPETNYNIEL